MRISRAGTILALTIGATITTPMQAHADHGDTYPHVNSRYWNVCPYVDGAPAALDAAIQRISATNVNA